MQTDHQRDGDLARSQPNRLHDEPIPLRPLTLKRKRAPRIGELYTRTPATEADIRSGLSLDPRALVARLAKIGYPDIDDFDNPPGDFLCPEALVYLYRHHGTEAKRAYDESRFRDAKAHRDATAALGDSIDHFIARSVRKWLSKLPGQARVRAEDEVVDRLKDLVNTPSAKGDALEVCFGRVLRRRCQSAFDKHAKAADHSRLSDFEAKSEPAIRSLSHPSPDATAHIRHVLGSLPEDQREAFVKRELEEVPYKELKDQLGVSERTIYARNEKAKGTLRQLLNEDNERSDDTQ